MAIVVFWLDPSDAAPGGTQEAPAPRARRFDAGALAEALAHCETLRRAGMRHVTISSELDESVTVPGVSEVQPGYDWKKRRE